MAEDKLQLCGIRRFIDMMNIVCIGTTKVPRDSVGPRVGTLLETMQLSGELSPYYNIIGTEDLPFDGTTMEHMMPFIDNGMKTLAIDAAVITDNKYSVGDVVVCPEGIKPGAGIGKELPTIGDMSVKCYMAPSIQGLFTTVPEETLEDAVVTTLKETLKLLEALK